MCWSYWWNMTQSRSEPATQWSEVQHVTSKNAAPTSHKVQPVIMISGGDSPFWDILEEFSICLHRSQCICYGFGIVMNAFGVCIGLLHIHFGICLGHLHKYFLFKIPVYLRLMYFKLISVKLHSDSVKYLYMKGKLLCFLWYIFICLAHVWVWCIWVWCFCW